MSGVSPPVSGALTDLFSGPQTPDLPIVREDLELLPGPRARDGAPTWTVYDPVRGRYFRITQTAFELLSHWHLHDWDLIAAAVHQASGRRPQEGERDWMIRFLHTNMLVRRDTIQALDDLHKVRQAGKTSCLTWALHHYLFFRIPLVRPERFLMASLPFARLFVTKPVIVLLILIAGLGGYLTLRQWDTYLSTFMHFTTTEGLLWYGLALAAAKVIHELGHAYVAAHYGCRVPSMGAAFLVMWPVLYTDTTDAWRLTAKRQRLAIGAAGMTAEVMLAVLATFLWSFLPDGPPRSAAFVVATVTWVMTLSINLNPFMRFDGYYLLSDALEVENLQDRAFAHAKWWLRERLFGLGESAPEAFPTGLGRVLIGYAFATWTYRLVLFLGIAVLVYTFFFKLLGIFLFAVELAWFIFLPIFREILQWWKLRETFHFNRNLALTLLVSAIAIILVVTPWRTTIAVPAVLQATDRARIFAPVAARIQSVHVRRDDWVAKGDVLVTLTSPALDSKIVQSRLRIALAQLQVRREASGGQEAENIRVLQRRLAGEQTQLKGLEEQLALLTVRAPIGGRVMDFDASLQPGLWVDAANPLALLIDPHTARLDGFIDERDYGDVAVGASATFYPEDPTAPALTAHVSALADVNSRAVDLAYLASTNGGDIPVEADSRGNLIPTRGIYRLSLTPSVQTPAPAMVQRGTVHIEGAPQSLASQAWNRVWSVLVRESGF